MIHYLKQAAKVVLCILIAAVSSCTFNTKFDKKKWGDSDPAFPSEYRNGMLNDLTKNHKLKGLTKKQIITLLGVPDYVENNLIIYNIRIDYGGDTDITYSKKLKFFYLPDSTVTSFSIIEWRKD